MIFDFMLCARGAVPEISALSDEVSYDLALASPENSAAKCVGTI